MPILDARRAGICLSTAISSAAIPSPRRQARLRPAALIAGLLALAATALSAAPVTFVFTSDLHYGLNRGRFRGRANVPAPVVNAALAEL